MKLKWQILIVLMLTGALVSAPASAQIGGANVGGLITDNSGGVLPGVTVTVTNTANGRAQSLTTTDDGRYRAVALTPGPYEISAELQGFGTIKKTVVLVVGADATVDLTLGVATVAETVTVVGEAPLVEVSKSQPSSVITGEQIENLPVLSRNFLVLAQLVPGTRPATGALFATTKFGGPGNQRFGYITLVDGGDLHEPIWGHPSINLSQDAVSEFKVYRNQFDAEYGGALSAIVSVVSKSGTNRQSGSGFYFGRDDSLNAKNAYAVKKPPFQEVRVGASNGGALIESRTHYFVSYEQQKTDTANITALPASNPFATLENGIYPNFSKDKNLLGRVDHRINEAHSIYVRYALGDWIKDDGDRPVRIEAATGTKLGPLAEIQKGFSQSLVTEEKWILSNTRLNNIRVHILDNQLHGYPHSYEPRIQRPSFAWGQFHRDPQWFPQYKYAFNDTFFMTSRGHDLKFGGEATYTDTGFEAHHYENGGWVFNTDAPFDPNNAATWPFSFEIRTAGDFDLHSSIFAAFAQDTWRVSNALTLNLGLRYDLETNIRDNQHQFKMFDNPLYKGIDKLVDRNRANTAYDNAQPRLGATWNIKGDGTLIARGGWGYYITYNQPWYQVVAQQQYLGTRLFITDPQKMRLYPNISAVLGGKTVAEAAATGGIAAPPIIGNDFDRGRQATANAGIAWQLTSTTSVDADFVRARGTKQQGSIDENLPEWGPISATNPRPISTLSNVVATVGRTKSSYDALEMQVRQRVRGGNSLQVSYTLARSLVDNYDGTLRSTFFNQKGYNSDDNRHILTASVSTELPWTTQLAVIGQFYSGSPKGANSGLDLDGDGASGDRPPGLPVTVGRGDTTEQLRIINDFRAARALPPFTADVLKLYSSNAINVRLTKRVTFGQGRGLEIFLEGFNVTNFVNRTGGGSNIRLATFGIPTGATDARQMQWGARYAF